MPKYKVTVTELHQGSVIVDADNGDAAMTKVLNTEHDAFYPETHFIGLQDCEFEREYETPLPIDPSESSADRWLRVMSKSRGMSVEEFKTSIRLVEGGGPEVKPHNPRGSGYLRDLRPNNP